MPALALLLGGDFHGIKESGNSGNPHPFAIHLFDGGNGSQLTLVIYSPDPDLPFPVNSPVILAVLGWLSEGDFIFQEQTSDICP